MAVATKQKPKKTSINTKRRNGAHQQKQHGFMQTYWPYLPLLLIVGVGIMLNSLFLRPNVLSYATNMSIDGLLANTNAQRTENQLGALAINATLNAAAQAKANDMVARDYWSHNTPDGEEPWVFITSAGYRYQTAGENLAYGFTDSGSAVTGWMNSPGHRANILNSAYTEVGFGFANSTNYQGNGEQTVVVAMYGSPLIATNTDAADESTSSGAATSTEKDDGANNSIVNEAIAVSQNETEGNELVVGATVNGPSEVSRVQIATSGSAPWSLVAASFFVVVLLLAFITRHTIAWHRVIVRGEKFILKHKFLDILVVSGIVAILLLTQTVGFIQ